MLPPKCVPRRDRDAAYTVQGITVDDECYAAYRDEYQRAQQTNDLHLRSRPVLQGLIRASTKRHDEAAANQST